MFCIGVKKQKITDTNTESQCFELMSQMTIKIEDHVAKYDAYPEFIVLEIDQIKLLKKYYRTFTFFRNQSRESPLMFNGVKILANPDGIFAYD